MTENSTTAGTIIIPSRDAIKVIRRLAVVGAGLAGLTVAHKLAAAGVEVTLFEKGRGPGGRMASTRLESTSLGAVDIGAQYFTVRNPAFRDFLVRQAGKDCWGLWHGRFQYQNTDGQWEMMRPAERYVGIPRMSAITRALARGLSLRNSVQIEGLWRSDNGCWALIDTEGGRYDGFDAVILTAPPVQSTELLRQGDARALAEDHRLRASRMQACWTVMAHFPEGAGADFEAVMPNQSLLNWAANDSSKPGRQGSGEWWVLHGDPDWSDDHACADPQQVAAQLVQELRRVGEITAVPAEVQVHRWLYARAKVSTGTGHLWFPDSGIAIIGDWLDGGRVEGAFNSADGLASRLISEGRVPRGG